MNRDLEHNSDVFKFEAQVPQVGEFRVELYPEAWTYLRKGLQKSWHWALPLVCGIAFSGPVVGKLLPPTPQIPHQDIPAQTK